MKKTKYGICPLSIVPVRAEPSDSSEMVTQLLFGETFELLQEQAQWRQIKITQDGYEGWIDEKQALALSNSDHKYLKKTPPTCAFDLVQTVRQANRQFPIVIGSSLPHWKESQLKIGEQNFEYQGKTVNGQRTEQLGSVIAEYAQKYLGAPYLWGGRSPLGIDCSGFVQVVFKLLGIPLLRDASQQVTQGKLIAHLSGAKEGDVAFFSKKEAKKIIHVGIILGNQKIIHACGEVRIDELHEEGIFHVARQTYTHRLRSIKRMGTGENS